MQCCNAAGTRALYDLWRYAIEEKPSKNGEPLIERVHLRFSVETPALKVVSYEPTTGRLDITARRPCLVEARLPAGTLEALVVFTAQASPRVQTLFTQDGYVHFAAASGEWVSLYYPLGARASEYQVGRSGRTIRCTGSWRGETLMQVDPPGAFYPLYNRSSDLEPVDPQLPGSPLIDSI
jgi:hypothetical protein